MAAGQALVVDWFGRPQLLAVVGLDGAAAGCARVVRGLTAVEFLPPAADGWALGRALDALGLPALVGGPAAGTPRASLLHAHAVASRRGCRRTCACQRESVGSS